MLILPKRYLVKDAHLLIEAPVVVGLVARRPHADMVLHLLMRTDRIG